MQSEATIKEVMPTDTPELVIRMSDESLRVMSYQDLLRHQIYLPPKEWPFITFCEQAVCLSKNQNLDLTFLKENARKTEASALGGVFLTIAEKQEGSAEERFARYTQWPQDRALLFLEKIKAEQPPKNHKKSS